MARRVREKDYIAAVKKMADRPKDVKTYRRFLFYGRNKKGKTTLALSAGVEKTLLIDPERGTDHMLQSNPYRIHVGRWEELQDVIGAVRTGTLSPKLLGLGTSDKPFEWLALDGLTRVNNLALRYIMHLSEETNLDRRPGIVDRRDYFKSGELMKELLIKLNTLPMNVIYTAQEKMKTFTSDDEDEDESGVIFIPDLPDSVRGAANSWVEVIGRLYVVKTEVAGKERAQRRLFIGVNDRYDTGFRSDYTLPDVVRDPTIPKLTKLMLEGPPPPKKKRTKTAE